MSSFMAVFSKQINDINIKRVHWIYPDTKDQVSSIIISVFSCCDSVARCLVQGVHQFNCMFGCTWYIHGEIVEKGNCYFRIYPLLNEKLQSHKDLLNCAQQVTEAKDAVHIYEVKSVSLLFTLTKWGFDMVTGFTVDYTLCIVLGVTRQFIDYGYIANTLKKNGI